MEQINYQLKLDEIIRSLDGKTPKLLLHACCGPCSSYVLEYLSKYFEITILYYNPNIYPEEEYNRRLNELLNFIPKVNYKNKVTVISDEYIQKDYYDAVKGLENLGEKSKRCYECYKLRMKRVCIYAKENNFDYFTTTLSISPYKVSKWINEIGKNLEEEYNIKYLYADFKKNNGYKRSLELSKEYGLYRQDYCGCSFSKIDREKYEIDKQNKLFNKIADEYKLGTIINKPIQNKIGITNKIYEVDTSKGKYIFKILLNTNLDKIEKSEEISNKVHNKGINSLCAIKNHNKYITNIDNYNILVYPYYNGKILLTKELTLKHIRLLAEQLGKLHNIKCNDTNINKYKKIDFDLLYKLMLDSNDECFTGIINSIDKIKEIYTKVYDSYINLSNQVAYIHKDFNRKNVLWNNFDFVIIDWETATIGNPIIDFFYSLWFLTNDFEEEKINVFILEYFKYMKLNDELEKGIYAALIEEINWLAYSIKRALGLISNNTYEIKLGKDSINSSLKEISNYYSKIEHTIDIINQKI